MTLVDEPLAVEDSRTTGHRLVVSGTGASVVHILKRLSLGQQPQWITNMLAVSASRALTRDDFQAVISCALKHLSTSELRPPSLAAYVESLNGTLSRDEALAARDRASSELTQLATRLQDGGSLSADEPAYSSPASTSLGVQAGILYAAFLVYEEWTDRGSDGWAKPDGLSTTTALRAALSAEDLVLLRDFYTHRDALAMAYVPTTPESQLQSWSSLVVAIEGTYDRGQIDLVRELTNRNDLALAVSMLSPPSLNQVSRHIGTWDERYFAATIPATASIMGSRHRWQPAPWWWFRVPRNLIESLRVELDRLGVLDAISR